ncbi:MAG: 2-phosphosulfolactate phosphatase [Planctomycetota bacterium]|nr:2-phosphosulfolactate phosphatase [Planctomycetota bacterium]
MPHPTDWLNQTPYEVRLEWGPRGAYEAAQRGDVVVLVDMLSFCTAVTTAVEREASIVPFRHGDEEAARAEAERLGVELLTDSENGKRRALSPRRYGARAKGHTYLLPSPNGATCSLIAEPATAVFLGCVRNASAAAAAAAATAQEHGVAITVVPCGERWPAHDDAPDQGVRPCVEDHLGAGAVITALEGKRSPEAEFAAQAFIASLRDLSGTLLGCVSGRELVARGHRKDVQFASEWDASTAVPRLDGDRFPAG